jgi:hypothetical protein
MTKRYLATTIGRFNGDAADHHRRSDRGRRDRQGGAENEQGLIPSVCPVENLMHVALRAAKLVPMERGLTEETAMEEDPKATEEAQLRHFDLRTWKAIELIAGHRTSSETIGVIAFDDLFDQLVLAARRIIAEQQIAVHRRDTEHYDAVTRELQGLEEPSKTDS